MELTNEKYELIATFYENVMLVKDPYNHHGEKVAGIVERLLRQMGNTPEEEIALLKWGARLHDVGKVFLADELMNLPRKLTQVEKNSVITHASMGGRLLEQTHCNEIVVNAARYHHEDWKGTGYFKKKEEEIPFVGRIVRLVDCYDAMTSARAYRDALSPRITLTYINEMGGILFDPELVKPFTLMMEKEINER